MAQYTISLPEIIKQKADILCVKLAQREGYKKKLTFSGLLQNLLIDKMMELQMDAEVKKEVPAPTQ